jgi:hypothetical protein
MISPNTPSILSFDRARSGLTFPAGSWATATLPRFHLMMGLPSWAICRAMIVLSVSFIAGERLA